MIILQDILSQEIVERLGWTLLHFIWQAAAVALILAILLRILRKSTANLRYISACLALVLIVLLPVITILLIPASDSSPAIKITPASVPTTLPTIEIPEPETIVIAKPSQPESIVSATPLKERVTAMLEPALPYIVSGWLIGVFGLSIWHLGGWTQLQRLKRRMIKQVDSTLNNKLKILSQKLKVKQTVQLMESALVQIPTVVGWLKPAILLPASAITGLNTEQLEAIIAHELAHIKRLDYLFNILQTIVEILGFYHPAVWWISYKIRSERENCCDDMAVSISGDRISYAGALASMEEIRAAQGKLAMAAGGGNLFKRICRLLGKDSTDNTGLSWIPAITVILLIIALAIPTTLALTTKTNSMPNEPQTELHAEDEIITTLQDKESLIENNPPAPPVLSKKIVLPDANKPCVRVNCLVVEVPIDLTIDTEKRKEAESILGNKVTLSSTKVNAILRQVAKVIPPVKKESDDNKRITEKQFNALIEMLNSTGCLKILINPTLEVMDGQTAQIKSTQDNLLNSIKLTPHFREYSNMMLEIEADLSSRETTTSNEPASVYSRQFATRVAARSGETLIIGGLTENDPSLVNAANSTAKPTKELLLILTPIIIPPPNNSPPPANIQIEVEKVQSAQKLKMFGLAVAMYADDHDGDLPENIQELKPYIRDEKDFDWLNNNIEYFDKGKTAQRNAAFIPIAYDRTLLEKADGTNVLFLDFSVRFVNTNEFEKLDLKRAEILIDARILLVNEDFLKNINLEVDTWDIAQSNLTPEKLKSMDFSKTGSLILNDLDVNLLLSAVKNQDDSKILANPQVLTREGKTAEISITSNEFFCPVDYTEPNSPSEKPQPKFQRVEEGIKLSLIPYLTPNKNIDMEFELELSQVSGYKEKMYKGKYPCKLPTIQRTTQRTRYIAKNGQTLLFGGHKIADKWDGQSEQKQLLILITAHTIDSPEQDKSVYAKNLQATEPKIIQTRTEILKSDEQEKTKPVTEQRRRRRARSFDDSLENISDKDQLVQKLFKLKHYNPSHMKQIILPLLGEKGQISVDERSNSLLVIDTDENLMRLETIIEKFDVPKVEQTVTQIFEIRNGDPIEIVELLKKLINGSEAASIIEKGKEPIVLIPHPAYKWIIVKASPENIKQIGQWIEKLDIDKSTMGMEPTNLAVYEQLETIVDLPHLSPQMSFTEVIEMLENSVAPPVQIQPIWRDLLENAEVEPATPAGIDPLTGIKLRKALEVLLIGISSTELPKVTYVVDDGVILIGTERMLTPRMLKSVSEQSDLAETTPDTAQPSYQKPEEPTPAINQHQMQILRQKYINDDIKVKLLNERIIKGENDLVKLRQKYSQSHPEVKTKASLLRALKKALRDREEEVGKTFDDLMKEETEKSNKERITTLLDELQEQYLLSAIKAPPIDDANKPETPSEQIQKQLDELIKQQQDHKVTEPNEFIPKAPLLSNTFIDTPILDALKYIAAAANINIITDETVKGLVSCKLKDVTVEKALDIVLGGTPYVWKKTPYYYLVVSPKPSEIAEHMESAQKPSSHTIVKPAIILIRHADVDELVSRLNKAIKQMPDPTSVLIEPIKNTRKIIVISKNDDDKEIIKKLIAEMDIPDSKLKPLQTQAKEDLTLLEIEMRVESAKKLSELGRALLIYANDHKDSYPNSLVRLSDYFRNVEDFNWVFENAAYRGSGKTTSAPPDAVMAYDKKLIKNGNGTNVLYNDCHVSFEKPDKLKKLDIVDAKKPKTPSEQIQNQLDKLIKQQQAHKVTEPNLPPPSKTLREKMAEQMDQMFKDEVQKLRERRGFPDKQRKIKEHEISERRESAQMLSELGKTLLIYANDHEDKYPDSLFKLSNYPKPADFGWIMSNVVYLGAGKATSAPPDAVMAYDKKLLEKGNGTNVLYNDCHVSFEKPDKLKKLRIGGREIMIETVLLSVSKDYLKDVGLNGNIENFSDAWAGHLAAKYSIDPNHETYGLMIDDLHVCFLLKNVQADYDSKALVAPRVTTREGETASINIMTEEYYYLASYYEPNNPNLPQQEPIRVEIGTYLWLKPTLTPDNKKVNLNLKLENTQLKGFVEGKYKSKRPTDKPIVDVISTTMPCIIPDGKTMLIVGLKTNEKSKKEKMLLILIKPIINPKQKATMIQEDEEQIRSLAEKLDKKINPQLIKK